MFWDLLGVFEGCGLFGVLFDGPFCFGIWNLVDVWGFYEFVVLFWDLC